MGDSKAVLAAVLAAPFIGSSSKPVYAFFHQHGRATMAELDEALGPSAHKRITELIRGRLLRVCEKRQCAVSGKTVTTWEVTGAFPISKTAREVEGGRTVHIRKPVKGPSSRQLRDALKTMKLLEPVGDKNGVPISSGYRTLCAWLEHQFTA